MKNGLWSLEPGSSRIVYGRNIKKVMGLIKGVRANFPLIRLHVGLAWVVHQTDVMRKSVWWTKNFTPIRSLIDLVWKNFRLSIKQNYGSKFHIVQISWWFTFLSFPSSSWSRRFALDARLRKLGNIINVWAAEANIYWAWNMYTHSDCLFPKRQLMRACVRGRGEYGDYTAHLCELIDKL